jgi:hypothetical protein
LGSVLLGSVLLGSVLLGSVTMTNSFGGQVPATGDGSAKEALMSAVGRNGSAALFSTLRLAPIGLGLALAGGLDTL